MYSKNQIWRSRRKGWWWPKSCKVVDFEKKSCKAIHSQSLYGKGGITISSRYISKPIYILLFWGRSSCIVNFRYHPILLTSLLSGNKMNVCTLMFWARECSLEIEDQNIGFYRKLLSSWLDVMFIQEV